MKSSRLYDHYSKKVQRSARYFARKNAADTSGVETMSGGDTCSTPSTSQPDSDSFL